MLKNWRTKCGNQKLKAYMASCAWIIWKARCNKVFNRIEPAWCALGHQAISMVEDLFKDQKRNTGKLTHSPFHSSLSLFTDAAWSAHNQFCGHGFILVNENNVILLAGASFSKANSSIQAEVDAMEEAIRRCLERDLYPHYIYTDCIDIVEMIYKEDLMVSWRIRERIETLRRRVACCTTAKVEYIYRDMNSVADEIAKFALTNPVISLFHRGLDLPNWLVEAAAASDLSF